MAIDAALRPLRADDSERLLTWRNLPEVSRWMYTDHEISREEHERWFAKASVAPDRRYWIVEYEGRPVGLANLVDIDLAAGAADWAFYLADAAVRGTGLGAFVEFSIIEKAFGEVGLTELYCEVISENAAVLKLHGRFGFQQVALLPGHVVKAGVPLDVHRLRLTASDWASGRGRSQALLRARGYAV